MRGESLGSISDVSNLKTADGSIRSRVRALQIVLETFRKVIAAVKQATFSLSSSQLRQSESKLRDAAATNYLVLNKFMSEFFQIIPNKSFLDDLCKAAGEAVLPGRNNIALCLLPILQLTYLNEDVNISWTEYVNGVLDHVHGRCADSWETVFSGKDLAQVMDLIQSCPREEGGMSIANEYRLILTQFFFDIGVFLVHKRMSLLLQQFRFLVDLTAKVDTAVSWSQLQVLSGRAAPNIFASHLVV